MPLEVFVNKFAHSRFEPAGFTKNPDIPIAKSIADYIFRWLGMEFIAGYREANAPKRPGPEENELAASGAPVLKVNGQRTATIADLEHAEAVMGVKARAQQPVAVPQVVEIRQGGALSEFQRLLHLFDATDQIFPGCLMLDL